MSETNLKSDSDTIMESDQNVLDPSMSDHLSTKHDTAMNQSSQVNSDSLESTISKDQKEINQEIILQEKEKELKGLQNQGATCYMNSLLQSLYMTLEFRQMIYKWRYDPNINPDKKDCIIYQLQKLFATLEFGNQPYAMTHDLTGSFQWDTSQSFEQQDVQEFMRVLFDAIEQSFEINNIFGVVEDLYMGEGSDFLRCHQCGYTSENKTKFYDLQLPIKNEFEQTPPNGSVEQALFGYLKPEILQGDNAYYCSGCLQKVTASKGSRLERLPKILTLQLQRFTLDMVTWQRKKLNDRVTFPMVLNMNHFLNEQKQQDWAQTEKLIAQNPLNEVRPAMFKADCQQAAYKENMHKEKVASNEIQARYQETMARELGEFDETNLAPQAKGKLAEQRRAEQLKQQQEHKEKLRQLKLKTKAKTKKRPALDKQINSNFFTNAKSNKDAVQGWAFDFENPDAGQGGQDDIAIMKQVMEESIKDSHKSEEARKTDEIGQFPQQNKSADQVSKNVDTEMQTIEQVSIKADLDDQPEKTQQQLSKEEILSKIEFENSELRQKYLQEGNFVYELYALMVHNGGAYGGHYYAYIKDIETGKWYNFNDSSVRPISILEVVEMFGPEPPSKKSSMAAKRLASTRNANAYMMMYRLIDPSEDITNLKIHEDEIPQDVLLDVKSSEFKQKEYRTVQDKKSQTMQLKVIYYPVKTKSAEEDQLETRVYYVDRREDTYETFFDKVFTDFIRDSKPRSDFRLRAYNVQYKIMLDTYTGRESETLEMLKIYPMKTLAFEEKLPNQNFEEYDPNSMVIKVNVWRDQIQSLSEEVLKPNQIKVQKETMMSDFLSMLSEQLGIKKEHVVVLKRNPMLNTKCMELLSDQPNKHLGQLRVNEGVNLFVEDSSVEMPEALNQFNSDDFEIEPQFLTKPTKWEKEFELESNRFQVKFNDPTTPEAKIQNQITAQQISDSQKQIYTKFTIVDRRISVLDLKIKIAESFNLSLSELVFRRGGSHGTELLEDEQSLKQAQFYNMISLYLEKGIPSKVGQKRVKMFFAQYSGSTNIALNQNDQIISADMAPLVALPDHCFFQFQELLEIPVKTAQKINIVKTQVIKKIDEAFPELGLLQIEQARVRFREKSGEDKLTQVFHGNRDLNRYQIYDGKEIAIQIVHENETQIMTEFEQEESYLVLIKLWNQPEWTLSDPIELYIPKIATLDQFADILCKQFPFVAKKDFKCTKINSSWNFSRVQLPYEQWVSLDQCQDFFTAAPFYVSTDGILFIIKDSSLQERDMTLEERDLYRSDDFEVNLFSSGGGAKPGTKRSYHGPKEKGVKIKVKGANSPKHQDQQEQEEVKEMGIEIQVKHKDVEMTQE